MRDANVNKSNKEYVEERRRVLDLSKKCWLLKNVILWSQH